MKIVKLEAENIKRLSAVEITPEGNLIVIGGRNAQGKTSVLDSIMYALDGKASIPSRPLRDGQEHGHVTCELDDLVVKRTFTESGGGQLIVANREGARYQSPQSILDKLTGRLTFDPLRFKNMEPREQLATLRALVGIDLSDFETRRAETYEKRAGVNRTIAQLKGQAEGMAEYPDAPVEEVSVSRLLEELEAGQQVKAAADRAAEKVRDAAWSLENQREAVAHAEEQLRVWQERHDAARAAMLNAEKVVAERTEAASVAEALVPDLQPIRDQLASAEETNRQVRENAARSKLLTDLQASQNVSQGLTDALREIDRQKAEALAAAEFPVEGLSFAEDGVTFGGVPFDQASSAEQLRVSVAMGLALNPKLRVLLIRDGSLLDEDSLRLVAEMAEQADAQVWLERVGDGEECSVVIEDGAVRGSAEE